VGDASITLSSFTLRWVGSQGTVATVPSWLSSPASSASFSGSGCIGLGPDSGGGGGNGLKLILNGNLGISSFVGGGVFSGGFCGTTISLVTGVDSDFLVFGFFFTDPFSEADFVDFDFLFFVCVDFDLDLDFLGVTEPDSVSGFTVDFPGVSGGFVVVSEMDLVDLVDFFFLGLDLELASEVVVFDFEDFLLLDLDFLDSSVFVVEDFFDLGFLDFSDFSDLPDLLDFEDFDFFDFDFSPDDFVVELSDFCDFFFLFCSCCRFFWWFLRSLRFRCGFFLSSRTTFLLFLSSI